MITSKYFNGNASHKVKKSACIMSFQGKEQFPDVPWARWRGLSFHTSLSYSCTPLRERVCVSERHKDRREMSTGVMWCDVMNWWTVTSRAVLWFIHLVSLSLLHRSHVTWRVTVHHTDMANPCYLWALTRRNFYGRSLCAEKRHDRLRNANIHPVVAVDAMRQKTPLIIIILLTWV